MQKKQKKKEEKKRKAKKKGYTQKMGAFKTGRK